MKLFIWVLMAFVCTDVVINNVFKIPDNNIVPSKLARYFDYGRSIEAKLFKRVGANDVEAAHIVKAGWFEEKDGALTKGYDRRMYVYGMSFSNHIGEIIEQESDVYDVKMYAGPGAPLNHSYTYYQRHRPNQKGDIVILGILASAIPRLNTLTHMTASFESPAAQFYPRYFWDDENNFVSEKVELESLSGLRALMNNEQQWLAVKDKLLKSDAFYDPIVFSQNDTDKSAYLRLLKRSWAQKHTQQVSKQYHDSSGFKNKDRMLDTTRALVTKFVKGVRQDSAIPYVILFNSKGFSDHLYNELKPVIDQHNIEYYSTHLDFPAEDLSNFIPDGHFRPEIDHAIAMKVLENIERIVSHGERQ